MAKGDLFKRTLEAGTSLFDMTRERAEAVVKEWVDAGELGKGKAQKAIEEILDRSRRATEDVQALIRREIGDQMAALGIATRADVARLEAKIDAAGPGGKAGPAGPGGKAGPAGPGGKAGPAGPGGAASGSTTTSTVEPPGPPSQSAESSAPGPGPVPATPDGAPTGAGDGEGS